jgi:hypothetical protein
MSLKFVASSSVGQYMLSSAVTSDECARTTGVSNSLFHVELAHRDGKHHVEDLENGHFHQRRHLDAMLERDTSRRVWLPIFLLDLMLILVVGGV